MGLDYRGRTIESVDKLYAGFRRKVKERQSVQSILFYSNDSVQTKSGVCKRERE